MTSWCLWPGFRADVSGGQLGSELVQASSHLLLVDGGRKIPDKVARLAALLFLRLSNLCDTQTFFSLPSISELINCASISSRFEPEVTKDYMTKK